MKTQEKIDNLEKDFNAGKDMGEYFDFDKPTFPNQERKTRHKEVLKCKFQKDS